ncbi:hypothetical protein EDS67_10905 [candidate division KSB1 bacterium]|nr:MAG: hypothetical protein EDS67_10905 [candidate division KSB1 bacterium]MBC6948046.1 hypothetical protein [candidate division KSB1 bacterium]MCE7941986.1 hypothetical protein [Chlorobi bacterium CHB1]MDL1874705.1 hypothetical protein [Cytophagia bacterium CHB2]
MSDQRNKWDEAIAKMIQLTQEGKLKWAPLSSFDHLKKRPDDLIEIGFEATFNKKNLALYKRMFKNLRIKKLSLADALAGSASNIEEFWDAEIIMQFLSSAGRPLWEYPSVNLLKDLMSVVQYQVAGVNEFLKEILNESK